MTTPTQTIGFGAIYGDCTTSGGTYTPWTQCVDIEFPSQSAKKEDTWNLGSSTLDKTYISGVREGSEYTVEQLYDPVELNRIAALVGSSGHFFKLTDPAGTHTVIHSGFVCGPPVATYSENIAKMKTKVQVSGAITYA